MGMIFYGRRLAAAELDRLRADPSITSELLYAEGDRNVDLDKAWHAIHYLLTGTEWITTAGAGEAVLGGAPIGEDAAYGPPRLLTPDQVKAVAAGLAPLDAAELRSRFDADALEAADIYPQIWDEGDDAADYVLPAYEDLRELYTTAAANDEAVLVAIL